MMWWSNIGESISWGYCMNYVVGFVSCVLLRLLVRWGWGRFGLSILCKSGWILVVDWLVVSG